MIDIDRVRADTPACSRIAHLNNAGSSLMPGAAYDAMIDYLQREQAIGGYETAAERASDTARFYQEAARLYGCSPEEIAYCESDTQAWLKFFHSLRFSPGDRIVTTQLNYGSHFVSFIQKAGLGVETVLVGCDANGDVDLHGLEKSLDGRTRLITMSHIPTGGGTICPAAEVGRIARDAQVPFVLDACQSSGQIPVRVREIGCTAMTSTGRKYLRGPRGTGLLYVERSFLGQMEPAALDQHGVELLDANRFRLLDGARRFENYEVNHAARVGLGAAIAYANEVGMEAIGERVIALGAVCRQLLSDIPGVTVHDRGSVLGGIVTFSMSGMSPREIQQYLHTHGVNISVSGGAGGRIDFQARGIDSLARASLHYFNTREEIQKMAGLLAQAR